MLVLRPLLLLAKQSSTPFLFRTAVLLHRAKHFSQGSSTTQIKEGKGNTLKHRALTPNKALLCLHPGSTQIQIQHMFQSTGHVLLMLLSCGLLYSVFLFGFWANLQGREYGALHRSNCADRKGWLQHFWQQWPQWSCSSVELLIYLFEKGLCSFMKLHDRRW